MPRRHEQRYRECEECLALLVTQRAWWAADPAERAEMAAEGYAPQGVGPRCKRCTYLTTPRTPKPRKPRKPRPVRICDVPGCGGKHRVHGLCNRHYLQARRAQG